jgi:Na+/pantothenate symporter
MSVSVQRRLWALGLGGLTLVLALYWRDWPMQPAVLVSMMVGVLAYAAVQAVARLIALYRRDARVE